MKVQTRQTIFNLAVLGIICCLIPPATHYYNGSKPITDTVEVIVNKPELNVELMNNPAQDLFQVMNYYNIKFPEIVYAQAVLETGHFTSKVCNKYNNLFGLYNSSKHDYFKFKHWSESVMGYVNKIQYRYHGSAVNRDKYYHFLDSIGYAEDPNYINKVKSIAKRYYGKTN